MDWPCWEMDEGIIDLTQNVPLPVKGYTGQSNDNVALANRLKEAEERCNACRCRDEAQQLNLYTIGGLTCVCF